MQMSRRMTTSRLWKLKMADCVCVHVCDVCACVWCVCVCIHVHASAFWYIFIIFQPLYRLSSLVPRLSSHANANENRAVMGSWAGPGNEATA